MTTPTPPERKHPRAWAILAGAPGPFPSDFSLTLPVGACSTASVELSAPAGEPAPALLAHAQFTPRRGLGSARKSQPGPYAQQQQRPAGSSPTDGSRSPSPLRPISLGDSRATSPMSAREALGGGGGGGGGGASSPFTSSTLSASRELSFGAIPWPADFAPPPEVVPSEAEVAAARALPRAAVARAIARGSTLFATHAPSDFALKLVPQPRETSPLSRSGGNAPSPLLGGSFLAAASTASVAATVRGGLLGSAVAPLISQGGGIGAASLRFGGACAALAPHSLRFGTLRAGHVYEMDVFLHNLSKAERPLSFRADPHHAAPRGGAHAGNSVVLVHEAGPLARGMSRALTVRIYARREGVVSETVGVCCPGEELPLPVTARVVGAEGFEQLAPGARHSYGSSSLPVTADYFD